MEIIKKVIKQTSWQLIGKIFTSLSTIIILSALSRVYGEEGVGSYTLVLTYISFFFVIADLGLNAYVLPELIVDTQNSEKQNLATNSWQKLLGLRVTLSMILVVVAILGLPLLPYYGVDFRWAVILGSLGIVGNGVFISANALFQSKLRYDFSVISTIGGGIFYTGCGLVLIQAGVGISWIIAVNMVGWLICGMIALYFVYKLVGTVSPRFDFDYSKDLLLGAWPISLSLVLNLIYFKIDTFILSWYRSIGEVGVYNLGYSPFQALLVLPTFIMNGFYPILLKNKERGNKEFRNLILQFSGILFFLSIFVTFIIFYLSPFIINIISGYDGFVDSPKILQILSLGFVAYFLSALYMWVMVTLKQYKLMVSVYLIGLLVNLLLNILFIPGYGYFAAAWSTVISEYLILLLQIIILFIHLNKNKK